MKPPRLSSLKPRVATLDTRSAKTPDKTTDPFYLSPEYRAWRDAVIRRAAGRCQDPQCRAPHRTEIRLFADHVRELKDGGAPLDVENGIARCGSCHTRKTAEERAKRMAAKGATGAGVAVASPQARRDLPSQR